MWYQVPKMQALISNGRSCSVNTVLWNTIQLLFPQDIEARKAASALNSQEAVCQNRLETAFYLATSVIYTDSAFDVWADLKERFSQSNALRLYQSRRAISSLRQDQSYVAVYFNKLKGYWDELTSYSPLPPCNCGAMKTLHDRDQEEKVLQFLMGLHDPYAVVRGQILLMNPLPPLNRSYALVLQEEKQREITNSLHSSDGMALAVNRFFSGSRYASDSNGNGQGRGKGKDRTCDHCHNI